MEKARFDLSIDGRIESIKLETGNRADIQLDRRRF